MVTPTHIVPEWYFLPFYAILRAIPDKLGGVLALLGSILSLLTLPYLSIPEVRSLTFRPLARAAFFMFVIVALVLGWMGGKPIEYPYTWISQLASVLYFSYFLWMIPAIVYLEKLFWTNTDYVLKKKESWFHVYETKGF
jgi:ubiquinol-cytochrome c reductase cytochrome b subunit